MTVKREHQMKHHCMSRNHLCRFLKGNQRGLTLIETLVAVAILGAVGCVFFSALISSTHAAALAQEKSRAKSIAETQLEFVSRQDYQSFDLTTVAYAKAVCPDAWVADISAERVDIDGNPSNDDGIQKITATVYHHGELVLTTSGYKAEHGEGI